MYIGSLRETPEKVGVAYGTVATIFKRMQEVNLLKMRQNGVYIHSKSKLLNERK